jgi:plasmid stability protein
MAQIIVRDLDDQVIENLKLKASLKGHSLQQELREIIAAAASLTPAEKVAFFDRVRAQNPALPNFDVSAAIRCGRGDENT